MSRAAPTPIVDRSRVIAFFESGDIVAINHQGEEVWKTSITEKYGKFKNKFGLSGSPIQNQDHFFLLVDDEGPSYLVALDKASGKEIWKRDRTPRNSWSSPAMHTIDGVEQVVVSSAGSVDGYECSTGKLLWSYTDVGGNTGCTPISIGNGKFLIAASAGRDGGNAELAKKSNALMQIAKQGDTWQSSILWKAEEATPSWATPYGSGDHIYFFGKDGLTTVIAAGKEFRSIAENELWDPNEISVDKATGAKEPTEERRNAAAMFSGPTQYGYAIDGGRIIMRTGEQLFCIGK